MNEIYNIAIVEDNDESYEVFREHFARLAKEIGRNFHVKRFVNAEKFLKTYGDFSYDVIFMDIELPKMNGMEAAKHLRMIDKDVVLVFVTNLAQYAIKGYEVNAFDFVVKPFTYYQFKIKMRRILNRFNYRKNIKVWINVTGFGKKSLSSDDIFYVEVMKHNLIYHTKEGVFTTNGTMIKAQESLKNACFSLCNRCYLVNLKYVTEVRKFQLVCGGDVLQISHLKRNDFLSKLTEFVSGGQQDV